jgi:hypothetical protein
MGRLDRLRNAGPTVAGYPDALSVHAAVQRAAALVFVKERGQGPEQFSHERAASFAFGRVPAYVAAGLTAANSVYRQTRHTSTATVRPNRVNRRSV